MHSTAILLLATHLSVEMGPVSSTKALSVAKELLNLSRIQTREPPVVTPMSYAGTFDIHFGGDASAQVDSWTGTIRNFRNLRRFYENHKGLRKGESILIKDEATAIKVGLDWANTLKLPRTARNPRRVEFTKSSTVYVGMEERPFGRSFVIGTPYFASIEFDVTDGVLVSFFRDPPRVVKSWKLNVKPEALRERAIAEYRKAMAKIGDMKPNIGNTVRVGYVPDGNNKMTVAQGKGPRIFYYRLGVAFFFAKSRDGLFQDAVIFDAADGKLIETSLYQRPPKPPR